jgi:hypothetical protein
MRRDESHITKIVTSMNVDMHPSRGRPKKRWMDCVKDDMRIKRRWRMIKENGRRKHIVPTPLSGIRGRWWFIIIIILIISAERRPLLDIGLPQSSPRRSVLRCLHPAASHGLHDHVGGLPTLRLPVRGRHSRTFPPQRRQMLTASGQVFLRSAIRRAISILYNHRRGHLYVIIIVVARRWWLETIISHTHNIIHLSNIFPKR